MAKERSLASSNTASDACRRCSLSPQQGQAGQRASCSESMLG